MEPSVTIIVPVHNAEATLAAQVSRLLEVIAEMTSRFEIMVVDDGSTDHTEEIASDLVRRYPQVRLARHHRRRGTAAAVTTGLSQATGEIVFVQQEPGPISTASLRQLWQLRHDPQLVMARAENHPRPLDRGLIRRLVAWGKALNDMAEQSGKTGAIHMIRRQAAQQLEGAPAPAAQLSFEQVPRPQLAQTRYRRQDPSPAAALAKGPSN